MKAVAALVIVALAGCLSTRGDGDLCGARLDVDDVPTDAPQVGGPGPRAITVQLRFAEEATLMAWWAGTNATVETVALRGAGASSAVIVHAPAGKDVGLLAGWLDQGDDGQWRVATTVAAGSASVELTMADALQGEVTGTWSSPASLGFGPQGPAWQPQDLVGLGAGDVARVQDLALALSWTNGPDGGADFGIAVASGPTTFSYTNSGYQATAGAQSESRDLGGDELQQLGWGNGTPLRVGPSISTGGFATTGIPYVLTWTATLRDAPSAGLVCQQLGPVDEVDVTDG